MTPFLDQEVHSRSSVVTTDATPTTILTATFPPNTSALVTIWVVARNPANGDTKCLVKLMPVKRGAGALSIVGTLGNLLTAANDLGAATWDIQFSLSGDTVLMQVVGAAGTTINWYAWVMGGMVTA